MEKNLRYVLLGLLSILCLLFVFLGESFYSFAGFCFFGVIIVYNVGVDKEKKA